ncbi:MAG: glycine--tRNA ligase subunit beta [Hydrogenophaga sp.]|jgi:glycyl-tRNA synthetase beta chain|uniref:glycine--tRNA ligase subunit beta n=1 Tax=Hydrogenophaga intermedia TaxID=65786 RepID=UPI002043F745|nr:glycine--tRNA ligase subunit beta [Hydrogenophaga intermedia]MCM3564607.1 glycine--tRNA ligase subunit beta [Hydrogenophaga intermedia]
MTAQNLLVELFVEELPPKALKKLGEAFATVLANSLKAQGLAPADAAVTAYASPRRLGAHVVGVLARAADKPVSQKLMPVAVGLDANGQPTPALLKRLAGLGADASAVASLRRAMDGKAEALFFDSVAPGAELAAGLQKALDEAIAQLPIPKVMTYQLESGCALPGWDSVQFVRPAHGLVALHGSTVVPVKALGLAAGNATHGHRFEAKVDPVVIPNADAYAEVMQKEGAVLASFAERRAAIARQLQAKAAEVGGGCRPIEDDALLDEVTALVERPNVLVCEFEKQFLDVPQECLILTMKANQKYFPLLDAQGRLTNKFLVVSNISPADASAVIGGNERVVRPRLADAKFFFDQDRKKTLESRVEGLGKVVYHNQLGTQGERQQRVSAIAQQIVQLWAKAEPQRMQLMNDVLTAAQLAKTDLLTDMVGEFPELQGIMGGYYARHQGLSEDIAFAIEDHYKPRFAGDALPRNAVGTVVALADKLETLAGMFGIGNLPTGDKDPFALRRHALGVARMLIEGGLPLQFHELTRLAFSVFANGKLQDTVVQLDEFLIERLKGYLKDSGYSVPEVDAALYARQLGFWSTVPRRLAAVREFQALPEAPALAAANKRIGNILKKSEGVGDSVNAALLKEPAEQALFAAMQATVPGADAKFEAGDFTASLQALAALRAPVDAFFDGVMVNADDPALKANRLALLQQLHRAMNRVADLARLAA